MEKTGKITRSQGSTIREAKHTATEGIGADAALDSLIPAPGTQVIQGVGPRGREGEDHVRGETNTYDDWWYDEMNGFGTIWGHLVV